MSGRVLLYSGGMDSVAAWHLLGHPARVYIRIGSVYEDRELGSIADRGLMHGLTILDAGRWLGHRVDAVGRVPLRNLVFAVTAAAGTGADTVILGATAGETSPDKSRAFARLAGAAMSAAEARRLQLQVPLRGLTKRQVVARLVTNLGFANGEKTLRACPSCYAAHLPLGKAGCGQCTSCLRRWVAMTLNGITEEYVTPPWRTVQFKSGRSEWWHYLRRTPVRDWPGVLRLNLELVVAVRRQTLSTQRGRA